MTHVWEEHPVVYHYTTAHGLRGIIETQSLWATHYQDLNDFSEVQYFRLAIEEFIEYLSRQIFSERYKTSLSARRIIDDAGGVRKCALDEAKGQTDVLYKATFAREGKRGVQAEPFIVSFCTHANDDEYTRENGLLSQWRAYGSDGGFAIVLDSHALWEALETERQSYEYPAFSFGDVIYSHQSDRIQTECAEFWDIVGNIVDATALGKTDLPIDNLFQEFVNTASRFKHQAFKEEQEVRLVAVPVSMDMFESLRKRGLASEKARDHIKPVHALNNGKRYIILNEVDQGPELPISRIIVGPQANQDAKFEEIRDFVKGKRIKVTKSDTPFIPTTI